MPVLQTCVTPGVRSVEGWNSGLCKLSTEGAASLVLRFFTLNLINKLNSFIQTLTKHLLCRRMMEGVGDGNIPQRAKILFSGLLAF